MEVRVKLSFEYDRLKKNRCLLQDARCFKTLDPRDDLDSELKVYQIYDCDYFSLDLDLGEGGSKNAVWNFSLQQSSNVCKAPMQEEPDLVVETTDTFLRSLKGHEKLLVAGTKDKVHFRIDSTSEAGECKCDMVLLRIGCIAGKKEEVVMLVPLHLLSQEAWQAQYGQRD